jgi:UDP-glucuronate 4-epimerase
MKSTLITGGAGFIGSHLCERLLGEGIPVINIDSFNDYYDPASKRRNIHNVSGNKNYKLVEGDILDTKLLKSIFSEEKIGTVVHLAARAGVRPSILEPALYQEVNVTGTTNLLEVSKEFGVDKFIFGSSSSVYGQNKRVPFREDDLVDYPISPYAASKKAGELVCYTYNHLYGISTTCLRFFTVYGPRQRPDMAIHKFTKCIATGEEITMFGSGNSKRDYTFISDIVDGICQAITHCENYHIYNLGESETIELRELISLIAKCLGKEPRIQELPVQPGDVPITYADISRARSEIGFQPQVDMEEGVEKFVKWYNRTNST